MYNTELNRIYTNEKVQEALKMFANICESKNIKCWVCDPDEYESEAIASSFTLPGIIVCEDWWALLSASGKMHHFIYEALFSNGEDPDPYCSLVGPTDAKDYATEGVLLWVK